MTDIYGRTVELLLYLVGWRWFDPIALMVTFVLETGEARCAQAQ